MPRPSRRFIAALLWIAIALLPVRGFAAVAMPVLMSGMPPATAGASAGAAAMAMPCHGAMADALAQAMPDASAAPADASHTCSLCELCHGSVVAALVSATERPAQHAAPPQAGVPSAVVPRAPDSLFRPPRARLA